ncbi:MAG: hypothetical protein H0T42_11520 [Deltaproteobacteria bacterium]|nr:hypothetical protein [Deltaproteobacteria bacterium]
MAARIVRRSFASPFVVTLAAALPMSACYVQPGPRTSGSGTQSTAVHGKTKHSNPPRPTGQQVPHEQTPDHSTTNAGIEQTPAGTGTVVANPPRPAPVPATAPAPKQDIRWTITRASGTCSAFAKVTCPEPPPGQPRPSCNPPMPMKYTCLPEMTTDGAMVSVVQLAGQTTCQVEHPPIKCPPGAMCNPPPPQTVSCPQ